MAKMRFLWWVAEVALEIVCRPQSSGGCQSRAVAPWHRKEPTELVWASHQDFTAIEKDMLIFSYPFSVNPDDAPPHLQLELIELQCDSDTSMFLSYIFTSNWIMTAAMKVVNNIIVTLNNIVHHLLFICWKYLTPWPWYFKTWTLSVGTLGTSSCFVRKLPQ